MDSQWYRCMSAAALLKAGIDPKEIASVLDCSTSSVHNMQRAWHLYSENPALRKWSYAQIAILFPIDDKIPDFFARMDLSPDHPIASRKLKEKVNEYREIAKNTYNTFNLIHDDDFCKIDGHYIPLSQDDKDQILKILRG